MTKLNEREKKAKKTEQPNNCGRLRNVSRSLSRSLCRRFALVFFLSFSALLAFTHSQYDQLIKLFSLFFLLSTLLFLPHSSSSSSASPSPSSPILFPQNRDRRTSSSLWTKCELRKGILCARSAASAPSIYTYERIRVRTYCRRLRSLRCFFSFRSPFVRPPPLLLSTRC